MNTEHSRAAKSAATKQRIIDTMRQLLTYHPIEDITIRDICKEAGVTNGTFYHFFDSKYELRLVCFYSGLAEWQRHHNCTPSNENPIRAILDYVHSYYTYVQSLGISYTATTLISSQYVERQNDLDTIEEYTQIRYNLRLAQEQGYIHPKVDLQHAFESLEVLINGILFCWCRTFQHWDIVSKGDLLLKQYLDTIITDKYKHLIGL